MKKVNCEGVGDSNGFFEVEVSFLRCSQCERKSYGGSGINSTCNMTQPSGDRCQGTLEGNKTGSDLKGC